MFLRVVHVLYKYPGGIQVPRPNGCSPKYPPSTITTLEDGRRKAEGGQRCDGYLLTSRRPPWHLGLFCAAFVPAVHQGCMWLSGISLRTKPTPALGSIRVGLPGRLMGTWEVHADAGWVHVVHHPQSWPCPLPLPLSFFLPFFLSFYLFFWQGLPSLISSPRCLRCLSSHPCRCREGWMLRSGINNNNSSRRPPSPSSAPAPVADHCPARGPLVPGC